MNLTKKRILLKMPDEMILGGDSYDIVEVPLTLEEKKAYLKKRIDELLKEIEEFNKIKYAELNKLKFECPHEIKRKGDSAYCDICYKDFGWWCDKSPDKHCHYDNNDLDSCDFCGQPEERK